MAEVILKNIKKVYPHQEPAKKKKGSEEKKTNLQITDEGVLAVQEFSLNIADKEFIVLVGPSGCGKSTTLRMIAGLEDISGGELYIDGKLMNDVEPKDRDIAMVFQNYALYPHMNVFDNITYGLKVRGIPADERKRRAEVRARLKKVESEIEELGAHIVELENEINDPEVLRDHLLLRDKCDELDDTRFHQQELYDEWEKLAEEQETFENEGE